MKKTLVLMYFLYMEYISFILCSHQKLLSIFRRFSMKQTECWTWDLSKKFALYWARPVLVCNILTKVYSFFMFLGNNFLLNLLVYLYILSISEL